MVGTQGASGTWQAKSGHTVAEEEGQGWLHDAVESHQHHHTTRVGEPSPQAHCTRDGGLCLRTAKVSMIPSHCLGGWSGLGDQSKWSQPVPKDLGCPAKLGLQVQEFLSGAGAPYAGDNDDSDWSSTLELPFDNNNKWVMWCTLQVETPAWWPKLQIVLNQTDTVQFARQIQASFQMPKVKCLTLKMDNDYSALPTSHCIERDAFLPFSTVKSSGQDYQMKLPQKTLAYTKALQFWLEKAQPLLPGQLCQLAECVWELRESMVLLTSFTDEEVLTNDALLHWVRITSSRPSKPMKPEAIWEWNCRRSRRAHTLGSFPVTHGMGQSKPTTFTPMVSSSTISSQMAKTPHGNPITQKWKPCPVLQR